eukprot:s738_g4.t2
MLHQDQPIPDRPAATGPPQTPRTAGAIVKYLYGDVQKAGGDAARFYADDVIYEDMNYETPFIGQSAVEGFLKRFQNIQGVTFNLEEVSDGDQAVGFTYTIEIAGQPRGIRGITYYQVNDAGKVCYVRDVPESASKPPPVQQLARLLRPGLQKLQPAQPFPAHCELLFRWPLEDRLKVLALYKWYCNFWVDADVESSVELLPLWRQLLVSLQKFLASVRGLYGNHLLELRRQWDVQGHPDTAKCSLGNVTLETREGIIDVRLCCEMRRFQSLPGEAESRGVTFYIYPWSETVGGLYDGTEQMPKLFCQSASQGIEMRSWDVYRFEGKPGATRRGAVTYAVDEDDLRAELRMEPSAQPQGRNPGANPDGDEVILEDDETLSAKVGIHNFFLECVDFKVKMSSSDGSHYRSVLESIAKAFHRFDAGEAVNFVFVLHGPRQLVLSPQEVVEDPEEETMTDDEAERALSNIQSQWRRTESFQQHWEAQDDRCQNDLPRIEQTENVQNDFRSTLEWREMLNSGAALPQNKVQSDGLVQGVSQREVMDTERPAQQPQASADAPAEPSESQPLVWAGKARPTNLREVLEGLTCQNRKVEVNPGDVLMAMVGAHPRWTLTAGALTVVKDVLRPLQLEVKPTWELRGHQKDGYNWLMSRAAGQMGALLADSMGLGKTRQAIAYILGIRAGLQASEKGEDPSVGRVLSSAFWPFICVLVGGAAISFATGVMPLTVSLISGKSVLDLQHFEGNGAELREKVGRELRLTPQRLRLVTPENTEIEDEATISEELTTLTAMVGEGKEITDWCRDEMVHYSFQEVEDGLNLPADAIETSPKIIGKVMMLIIAKVNCEVRKDYNNFLKEHNGALKACTYWDWDLDQDELEFDEMDRRYNRGRFAPDADIQALVKPKWTAAKAKLKTSEEAAYAFAYLDDRLRKSKNNYFYCRWKEHEENGQKKRHRVYGIRQEYAAVEFDKVLDRWLEVEGRFDKLAAKSLTSLWETRITTLITVRQLFSVTTTVDMVRGFCSILLLALEDPENARTAWLKKHVETAKSSLKEAFSKATFILRDASGWRHVCEEREEAEKAVEGVAAAWMMTAKSSETLRDGLLNAMIELAGERREEPRSIGAKLLMAYFPEDPATRERLGECAKHDWPHARQKLTSFLEQKPAMEDCLKYYTGMEPLAADDLPSPRTLALNSVRGKPISLPAIHKSPRRRRMRNRQQHRELQHVLYDVGSDESDEDEDEIESE